MRHKIKILAAAGLAMMLTGVSVLAFSEVSVLMQAVSGKVAIRLEEFTVERERKSPGKKILWCFRETGCQRLPEFSIGGKNAIYGQRWCLPMKRNLEIPFRKKI